MMLDVLPFSLPVERPTPVMSSIEVPRYCRDHRGEKLTRTV
jgi:hypothetical protein